MGMLSVPLATIVYLLAVRAVPDIYFVAGLVTVIIVDWLLSPVWQSHEHHNHGEEEPQTQVLAKPDQRLVS